MKAIRKGMAYGLTILAIAWGAIAGWAQVPGGMVAIRFKVGATSDRIRAFSRDQRGWLQSLSPMEGTAVFLGRLNQDKTVSQAVEALSREPLVESVRPWNVSGVVSSERGAQPKPSLPVSWKDSVASVAGILGQTPALLFDGAGGAGAGEDKSVLGLGSGAGVHEVGPDLPALPDRENGNPLDHKQAQGPGKPLPPPPGQQGDGKPLPPPPGADVPRPISQDGRLPEDDPRLKNTETIPFGTDASDLQYLGYWVRERYFQDSAAEPIELKASDTNDTFIRALNSDQYQDYVLFYYDPSSGKIYHRRISKQVDRREKRVVVHFINRSQKPLLPWETENFVVSYNPDRSEDSGVRLEAQRRAYDYDWTFTSRRSDPLTVEIAVTAGNKVLTSPDFYGVSLELVKDGNGLKLVARDKWARYYQGETLQVAVVVRHDDGKWWRRDPVVAQYTDKAPIRFQAAAENWAPVPPNQGSGPYYIGSWSFRRMGNGDIPSKVSNGDWSPSQKGNRINY